MFSQACVCSIGGGGEGGSLPHLHLVILHWSQVLSGSTSSPSHNTSTRFMSFPGERSTPVTGVRSLLGGGVPQSQVWGGGTPVSGRGYPSPRQSGTPVTQGAPWPGLDGVPPWPGVDGVPSAIPRLDGVYPPSPPRQNSTTSTSYAAGGMPLAFRRTVLLN